MIYTLAGDPDRSWLLSRRPVPPGGLGYEALAGGAAPTTMPMRADRWSWTLDARLVGAHPEKERHVDVRTHPLAAFGDHGTE